MIASLRGKLLFKSETYAIVECGGVGMKFLIARTTYAALASVGDEVFLYTYLSVKEDALDLYGFSEQSELEAFKLITSVNGVGPKIGLAMLSQFDSDSLLLYIASGDAKALTAAAGVGIKLAQRIVLELKDKVGNLTSASISETVTAVGAASSDNGAREAIAALVSLGYTQSEASKAVSELDLLQPTDELIKQALKSLARRF